MLLTGIDYGNKMAGTTVIAALLEDGVRFFQSEQKKDADRFILDWVGLYRPTSIFLDAPLSLPKVYRDPSAGENYFYREADRLLNAMSPMFLGGLTARAMQLRARLEAFPVQVFEVYPRRLAQEMSLTEIGYKKAPGYLDPCLQQLLAQAPLLVATPPATWHHFDALLALTTGWRYQNNLHRSFGDPAEGVIIV